MYIIWKASINEYRVKDVSTGEVQVLENFTAINCTFWVNIEQYERAKQVSFANSGDDNDYFACIHASNVTIEDHVPLESKVFYNPFKSEWFRDRATEQKILSVKKLVINGNTLSYE